MRARTVVPFVLVASVSAGVAYETFGAAAWLVFTCLVFSVGMVIGMLSS